jgi:hypothetical protein
MPRTIVERIADRHVKRLTTPIEDALAKGRGRLSEAVVTASFASGAQARTERLVLRAIADADLRALSGAPGRTPADAVRRRLARTDLAGRLLDVAADSADATRCAVRPDTTPQQSATERLRPSARASQLSNELAVGQVESNLRAPLARPSQPRTAARTADDLPDMTDTVVRVGVRQHGINVHVFSAGASHRISVPRRVRLRLERWSAATGIALHTVAFDDRPGDEHSGHRYYHQRGIRSTALDRMTKVQSAQHLRELVRGSDVPLR